MVGVADLILDTEVGAIVIDHKVFPGNWRRPRACGVTRGPAVGLWRGCGNGQGLSRSVRAPVDAGCRRAGAIYRQCLGKVGEALIKEVGEDVHEWPWVAGDRADRGAGPPTRTAAPEATLLNGVAGKASCHPVGGSNFRRSTVLTVRFLDAIGAC